MTVISEFDLLAPGSARTAVLCAARVSGLVAIAPVFSSTIVPRQVRVAMLVLLTVVLQPIALAAAGPGVRLTVAAVAGEVLVGFGLGLGAALLIGAAEMAGDTVAVQVGLSGSAILDPLDTTQVPVLGVFARLLAVTLLLTFGLQHVMLQAMADSFHALPPGAGFSLSGGLAAMVKLGSRLFTLGVRFAAPVIAVALITTFAMALLGRAAAQLNLLTVSFPVQIAVGLFAFAAALPAIARTLSGWTTMYRDMIEHIGGGLAATIVR